MSQPNSRKRLQVVVAVVLMLAAMFAYLSSLDESDPDALPEAAETMEP